MLLFLPLLPPSSPGGELPGVRVALSAETSLGRKGQALFCKYLRCPVSLLLWIPGQHPAISHHSAHRQVQRSHCWCVSSHREAAKHDDCLSADWQVELFRLAKGCQPPQSWRGWCKNLYVKNIPHVANSFLMSHEKLMIPVFILLHNLLQVDHVCHFAQDPFKTHYA